MSAVQQKQDNTDDLREEERLEESREQLKELHLKLRALRTIIPRVIAPLSASQASPDALFTSYRKSVADTRKELWDFKVALTSEESKKLFDEASASRQAKPKGTRPWRASDDPNWTTLRNRNT